MNCAYHVGTRMVPVRERADKQAGTASHLHDARVRLRCPVAGCPRVDVLYERKRHNRRLWEDPDKWACQDWG